MKRGWWTAPTAGRECGDKPPGSASGQHQPHFSVSGIVYGGFDQIYNLYNPLVYDKADILETYLFRNGVIGGDYSLGTAMGLFNSVVAFILVILANKVIKKLGGEGIW
ncbi:MAG: hypothetical protein ACLSS9_07455 [Acutalibacteraceae bacterium]